VDADHERTPVLKKRGWEGEELSAVKGSRQERASGVCEGFVVPVSGSV